MDNPDIPALFDHLEPYQTERWGRERFDYAIGTKGPKKFFVKSAKTRQYHTNIQREVVWNEFMNRVEAFYPERNFAGLRIERRVGAGSLVFDYLDAPLLADDDELAAWQAQMVRYANMCETFDRVAVNWKADNLPDEPSRSLQLYGTWKGWLGGAVSRVPHLDKARTLVEASQFKLMRCLQHGGPLTPCEIFVDGDRWVIVDGERCGTDLFRYTDLADAYCRLYGYHGAKSSAQELLQNFILHHGRPSDQFLPDFIPVLTHRCVALIADALRDQAEKDYVAEAEELLRLCVDHDVSTIVG